MLINKPIPASYIFRKVKRELFYVLIMSIVVLIVTAKYNTRLPEMPLTIPTFIGTAISILLSFKLNQSYDRWWEARKVWGSIVNDSRSLVIQLMTFTLKGNDPTIKKIAFRQIAWCYSLGQSLRGLNPMENLEEFVSKEELAEIKSHHNKPLSLLYLNGMDIKKLRDENQLDVFSQVQLDDTLVRLCDAQGKPNVLKIRYFRLHIDYFFIQSFICLSLRFLSH
jgi:ion channel-forming bestrophin family protein